MQTKSNVYILVLAIVLVVVTGMILRPQTTATALAPLPAEEVCSDARSVQVSGAAVINVTPDRALLQLGVQTNGTTPDGTQNASFQAIQKVTAAVRALGVDAMDIATDYFIVNPVYQNYDSLTIIGYRINNTVSITLRDIGLVDDVIIAALKSGANEVQDVQFYTSELRKFRDEARALAMKAAGEKAAALASAAGAQSGCLLTASENIYSQYYGAWRGGRETTMWAQNVIQNSSSSQGSTASGDDSPISLGQIAVRAEISATYSLK